eukprot:13211703-Alexandrium_andersonii.AAC.1
MPSGGSRRAKPDRPSRPAPCLAQGRGCPRSLRVRGVGGRGPPCMSRGQPPRTQRRRPCGRRAAGSPRQHVGDRDRQLAS